MATKIQNCVKNMLICKTRSHCLFRGFGLNSVDRVGGVKRSEIKKQLTTYFPEVTKFDIKQKSTFGDLQQGSFAYEITVTGYTEI